LLWNGLKPKTRQQYHSGVQSYLKHCKLSGYQLWPATTHIIGTFITRRAYGSPNFQQLSANTLRSYSSAIRSTNTDLGFSDNSIINKHIDRLIKGASNLFPAISRPQRLPITRNILLKLISPTASAGEHSIDTLNLNAAFTAAHAGFLRFGEFTFKLSETTDINTLVATKPTRGSVKFSADKGHITLRLPRSKTDRTNKGVVIPMAATTDAACPVAAMKALLAGNPQPNNQPLFRLKGSPFDRRKVLQLLSSRFNRLKLPSTGFSGHSFWRGAAQDAHNSGLSDDKVQKLGRWASEAFRRYFDTSQDLALELQREWQSPRSPALQTTSTTGRKTPKPPQKPSTLRS
jgi:hypothetical protein